MAVIASWLDAIEIKLAQPQCTTSETASKIANPTTGIEEATRALMAVESEKEEIRVRARNVVISGLPPVPECCDKQPVE